jgi:hypothetical protein
MPSDREELITDAQLVINRMPMKMRMRGESLRQANLHQPIAEADGAFEVEIIDGQEKQSVKLLHNRTDKALPRGWCWDCPCFPDDPDPCVHTYAALKLVLANLKPDGTTSSRSAAARVKPAAPNQSVAKAGSTGKKGKAGKADFSQPPFAESVVSALGRPLSALELQTVKGIEATFKECHSRKAFFGWHANDLGFRAANMTNSWDRLDIWPEPPQTTLQFWHHLAFAVEYLWNQQVPDFLKPLAALETPTPSLTSWRRQHLTQHWIEQVAKVEFEEVPEKQTIREIDLRLRFGRQEAEFEMEAEPGAGFRKLPFKSLRRLLQDVDEGVSMLTPAAHAFWPLLNATAESYSANRNAYSNATFAAGLARLMLSPPVRSRLVNRDGQPYEFATGPVRWDIQEPPNENGMYQFQLVMPDGAPLPQFIAILKGAETVFISETTVYFGPPIPLMLSPIGPTTIPAVAIENAKGVTLFRRLQRELPARLRARIKLVPYRVSIHCALHERTRTSQVEVCRLIVTATSDQKTKLVWNGTGWNEDGIRPVQIWQPRPEPNPDPFTVYDRTMLEMVPRLLEPLKIRWDAWQGHGELRVTRQFPEQFTRWRQTLPPEIVLKVTGELATLSQEAVAGSVKLGVTEAGIDWFDLTLVLNLSETDFTPEEVRLLLDARGGYVRLKNKGWRRLRFELDPDEDEKLARLGLNPRELTSEPHRLHVLQLANPVARKFLPAEQYARVERRASDLQARVTPEIPAGLCAELRPYQLAGFHFLCYLSTNRFGGILADDMGLGKTLQTLAWIKWLLTENPQRGSILVVCPKSVTDNWRRETERFAPDVTVKVWSGNELSQLPTASNSAQLHVVNYTQLRHIGESLANTQWLAVILDEGQAIKNPSSQTSQVARVLRAEHRLVLTGTPIENRLMDLWSLMAFAMPGVLGSRAQFGRWFENNEDPFARQRLAARVRPFLVRRTKNEVARDLPDRIEEDLFCELEGEQQTLYRAELKRAQQSLLKIKNDQEWAKERFNFLTSLLRLRQICCDPRLVNAESKAASAKMDALLEQIEPLMEEGQKVLVFSQFVTMLDLIRTTLKEKGWPLFYLAGDTENRGDLVERFQAAPGPGVFLISLKAGGFGLNLTAAGYVILFDPWWNPAVENQAIDRTHRIGQRQNVIAYRLLMKNSVEEKIRLMQKAKRHLVEDVLGEERFSQSLTMDDLRYLLGD